MPKRTRDYEEDLIERLKNSEFAAEHLNVSLEDADEDGADERFLRQAIDRALSESGNPELSSLRALLEAMGLKLAVEQKQKIC